MDDPVSSHLPNDDSDSETSGITNDASFTPPARRDTASSKLSEALNGETCRICRSEGTQEEPLFYPCKCSGSIRYVHQECLMEWLSHSHKKHCELCKTPFRFTKLYDANMPKTLPCSVFITRACMHVAKTIVGAARILLVATVWLIILPWLIRWAWRWMFWAADAGWARETYMRKMRVQQAAQQQELSSESSQGNVTASVSNALYATFGNIWGSSSSLGEASPAGKTLEVIADALTMTFWNTSTRNSVSNRTLLWPQTDASVLSSWTYISELTPNPELNRIILDIFEGQLITCVVITGFILLFLIREWVVQQQPLVNMVDNLNNERHERDRLQQEQDGARRQVELLEQARDRLLVLQNEATGLHGRGTASLQGEPDLPEFIGWDALSALIDTATEHLRVGLSDRRPAGYDMFAVSAMDTLRQLRAAQNASVDVSEIADQVFEKLSALSAEERQAWEEVLVMELKNVKEQKPAVIAETPKVRPTETQSALNEIIELPESAEVTQRPPMPDRDHSSRATQIQRLLEEADSAFSLHDRHIAGGPSSRRASAEPVTTSASVVSEPSTEDSWQHVSAPNAKSGIEQDEVVDRVNIFHGNSDEMPITNAGPDAKINIKRSGKADARIVVPEPKEDQTLLSDERLRKLLTGRLEPSVQGVLVQDAVEPEQLHQVASPAEASVNNSFASNVPESDHEEKDSLRDRVASVFQDEFGLDEAQQLNNVPHVYPAVQAEQPNAGPGAETGLNQASAASPDISQRLADWFWGEIQVQGAMEPATTPNEELMGEAELAQQAPFAAPVEDHQIVPEDDVRELIPQGNDPEVAAAAQQAGLDAEAIEDAEDLEGVFELIGLQGPLIGLFQTSCFCCVLVTGTVCGAVGLPYVWGKLVLSLIGAPWTFLIKGPLQTASFISDLVSDITLVVAGWIIVVVALIIDIVCQFSLMDHWAPALTKYNISQWVSDIASTTASSAGQRLSTTFASGEAQTGDVFGWNWAFLTASLHAHSSLITLKEEVTSFLQYTGNVVAHIMDSVAHGSTSMIWQHSINAFEYLADSTAHVTVAVDALGQYTKPLLDSFSAIRSGALTLQSSKTTVDPSLVYWNSTDRSLAVMTGYIALAAVAAVYVALDKSITRSQAGQKTEKLIRDTLRQAGGVFKVILIISIEMLAFPLYCGLLLDLAFLPLFDGASLATRWSFGIRAPYTFGFVHWFVGTCYMFHFALFVGMCRKILRKGVLWFIRDPDDPTFHPVRDVLERNVTTQLRKIAFSALVYGALVILCLGGVIWSIGKIFSGIFPIHWISTEPVLEFPLDLALYNFLTPLLLRLSNPSTAVNAMYAWWLKRCARMLRLSHFLFDDRRKDEEGRHVRKTWTSFLLMRKGNPDQAVAPSDCRLTQINELPEVYFRRDGKYVLTPCNDQYKPPKAGEAFLHADDDDVYVTDKDGKKNPHFAKVYVPPFFRMRVTLFMVCLWVFSAFAGLCATLVPLVFGRTIFASFLPQGTRVNDIYSYSLGAYILGTAFLAAVKGGTVLQYLSEKIRSIDFQAWISGTIRYGTRTAKCIYVYGFTYLAVPSIFALILQLYLVLPMHTYAVASLRPTLEASNNGTANATQIAALFLRGVSQEQDHMPKLADHSIHILADYALCLIYLRIILRWIVRSPTSRAAEAVRRITADGYTSPNVRLATRFLIMPVVLVAAVLLFLPPSLIRLGTMWIQFFHGLVVDDVTHTLLYRYSYPITACAMSIVLGSVSLAKATSRWRSRIRDEVYLVGERLHNFGEKKPPAGSKSVVRKDR